MSDIVDIKSKKKPGPKSTVDEDALGRDVELLDLTNKEIGDKHGISESSVRYYTKKNGWVKKRLVSQVSERVQRKLIQGDSAISNDEVTDAMIDNAAEIGAEVVKHHREHLKRIRGIAVDLTVRIEQVLAGTYDKTRSRVTPKGTTLENWDFLGHHESISEAFLKLTRAAKTYIELERKTFNIDDDTAPDEATYEQRLARVASKHDDEDPQQEAS